MATLDGLVSELRTGNHFLDQLSPADLAMLKPALRLRRLEQDQVLARPHDPVTRLVLPVDAIISVLVELSDGTRAETRTVGREGGFGLLHALGSSCSFERVIVQIPGEAYFIDCREVAAAAQRSPSLAASIVRHAQAAWVQSARTVACNAYHDVKSRLCRWLLITQDRLGRDEAPLTQEHLSIMLCVQRTTVSAVAKELQARGAIRYSRGRIQILDRGLLQEGACECYESIESEARLMLSEDGDATPYLGPA
jgi:CRP-like cAMP-binding protein